MILAVGVILLRHVALDRLRDHGVRWLASSVVFSILLHLAFGRHGWYSRYEIYIVAAVLSTLVFLKKEDCYRAASRDGRAFRGAIGLMTVSVVLLFPSYLHVLTTLPIASNNIHEQQYPMHRFAAEYYNRPAVVNDVGWVSYRNDDYVPDLWGLASADVLRRRGSGHAGEWMDEVTQAKGVKCAMIHEEAFKEIPTHWEKLGELRLGKTRIASRYPSVSFYALDRDSHAELHDLLAAFRETLPRGAVFQFEGEAPPSTRTAPRPATFWPTNTTTLYFSLPRRGKGP